jgi:hypothetical protein
MMSFRGNVGLAQMTSLVGKLTALVCHPTKITWGVTKQMGVGGLGAPQNRELGVLYPLV